MASASTMLAINTLRPHRIRRAAERLLEASRTSKTTLQMIPKTPIPSRILETSTPVSQVFA